MFRFYAKKVVLELNQREVITSGSVNVYQCQFEFNSAWDGLVKTVVFRAGDSTVSVLLDETGMCNIPWEVLQDARRTLYVGVYGTKDGNVVLPTIWASCGEIKEGVNPGESTQPPTPSVYDQILGNIGNLGDLQTTDKNSLVDAINEVYETGGGGGSSGKDGGYYIPSVDDEGNLTWTGSKSDMPAPAGANIRGPQGPAGAAATINGVNSLALNATGGINGSQSGSTYTIDGSGKVNKPTRLTATLSASGWSGNSQTITATGVITDTSAQDIDISCADKDSADAWAAGGVWCSNPTTANQLTFTCTTAPTANINLNIRLWEVGR